MAKRFRRQLSDGQLFVKPLRLNYLTLAGRRLDIDSLFIIDLSDLAKPYANRTVVVDNGVHIYDL